ncbi:hypothetical protein [Pseudomarimonas arenosa]|uniref:Metallopeptidase DUF4344 n=1 Tax=Pseudomarimonas arenosa TaxID=2774145 RepID=A0AAW3ZMU1_9GAMM|nr:hypothetical protein [Pseudomarimonas arenosa]MBD8525967.1 hypothetical protein [Pseudomarimonas arenosa]
MPFWRLLLCWMALLAAAISAPLHAEDRIAALQRIEFLSNLHVNQHHFLHALARERGDPLDYLREHAKPALSEPDLAPLQSAIDYYRAHLVKRNLLFDGYLHNVKLHLMEHASADALSVGKMQQGLYQALLNTRPIYEEHFWPAHDAANRQLVMQTLSLLRKIEQPTLARIEQLAAGSCPEKITVHLSWFANAVGAYTTIEPQTVAVIESRHGDSAVGRDNFVELVFHEPTHAVILQDRGSVAEAIAAASDRLGARAPRDLWHAILFFFVGVAVQEQLAQQGRPDYELYMKRNEVFKSLHPAVLGAMPDYVAGKHSLQQAVERAVSVEEERR